MHQDDDASLTLSREDLYELLWSKPMRELAKDFGISDVGLTKRCRRLGIPVPGRGYWSRVDAGQQPYRPRLYPRDLQWFDEGALTVTRCQVPDENLRRLLDRCVESGVYGVPPGVRAHASAKDPA